ncbi:b(o/a)3-type cytochrome-c oxidase subunit 1 [Bacillus badius]|uniref:Cytochrome c oxidase (B(O/a)3-type) chain I n=1 Tax=Bacillus badius TaxID=1455 RepID=A0ABR5ASY4_BACBA|nr:b(o/a)3-type cytochrome-c oxidase subunit 1 [Bacillus badius]KIL77774.1 Cytochrome c oxidase (B(O/a)3-type) chain I [Bacillus badius]KZR59242.1 cytochrome C [Bacillus badius]MED4715715.1 b(o/a)3-type cytochrome-c oxidase subunit 1 [Bacillus badius]
MRETIAKVDKKDAKLALAHMIVAFTALFLGGICGLLQVLVRSGKMELPAGIGYYQLLTAHGVLLALILTTFFIIGFQFAGMSRTAGTLSDKTRLAGWIGFWTMTIGTAITTFYILTGEASVLYTFYAPLQAHVGFYIGLALVVVGSWIAGFAMFVHYAKWKKQHPGQNGPLLSFMIVVNMALWLIASLGVAATVLLQFIPWSLGWTENINVLVSRTLFWYFGHPLVYFWLLPAYMIWYVVIPKVIGGKIFSDSLARMSFILFLFFSVPVGFHHQLTEPGIDPFWKYIQVVLTLMVVIPSLMTAFSMFAMFERFGRSKGASSLFGWLRFLPWKDARFLVPFIGMIAFIPGGAGGIINASHQLNQVVHNTIWVTGHFHLTIATTVILTFFGAAYWLIPHLTGRTFTNQLNQLAIVQAVVWSIGMLIMSGAMHWAGLYGAPRRSSFSLYGNSSQAADWIPYQIAQAVGGTMLFLGILLVLYIVVQLLWFAPKGDEEFPIGETEEHAEKTPLFFDKWWLWIIIVVVLILLAYTIPFAHMIEQAPPGSPGYRNLC